MTKAFGERWLCSSSPLEIISMDDCIAIIMLPLLTKTAKIQRASGTRSALNRRLRWRGSGGEAAAKR